MYLVIFEATLWHALINQEPLIPPQSSISVTLWRMELWPGIHESPEAEQKWNQYMTTLSKIFSAKTIRKYQILNPKQTSLPRKEKVLEITHRRALPRWSNEHCWSSLSPEKVPTSPTLHTKDGQKYSSKKKNKKFGMISKTRGASHEHRQTWGIDEARKGPRSCAAFHPPSSFSAARVSPRKAPHCTGPNLNGKKDRKRRFHGLNLSSPRLRKGAPVPFLRNLTQV